MAKAKATSFKPGNKAAVGRKGGGRPSDAAVLSVIQALNGYVYHHPKPTGKGQKQLPPEPLPELVVRTIAEGIASRVKGRPTGTAAKFVEIYLERVYGRVMPADPNQGKKAAGRLIDKIGEAHKAHAAEALDDIVQATRETSPPPAPMEEA